jgi:hypothetical protein
MEGIGRPASPYDFAARGAGGTAIGVCDPFGMSAANPALIAWAQFPQADFGVVQEERLIRTRGDGGYSHRGHLDVGAARVVLPLPRDFSLGVGYRTLTDGGYEVHRQLNRGREDEFHRTLTGSGGVGELAAILGVRVLGDRFAAGLQAGWSGGTLRDLREDQYTSGAYVNTKDLLRTRLRNGRSWALGVQGKPAKGLSFGIAYHGKADLNGTTLWTSTSRQQWGLPAKAVIPEGVGLGVAVTVHGRNRLALDWSRDSWAKHYSTGLICDAQHLGVGYTHMPGEVSAKDPVLRRAVWRAGLSWSRLPALQANGAKAQEWAVTGGAGLPVQVDRGYVHGLLEIGQTGDLGSVGLREVFVRLGVGVTFGRFASEF